MQNAGFISFSWSFSQDGQTQDTKLKEENIRTRRAVTCVPQGGGANQDANKPEEKQTSKQKHLSHILK